MADSKNDKPSRPFPMGALFVILAAAILALLFRQAFLPNYVHFGNDLPLGALNAKATQMPDVLTGWWNDLNWVGSEVPIQALNFTSALKAVTNPVIFTKISVPVSMLVLGLSVYFLFRQLGFHRIVALLGGLAGALNMHYFSNGCWGLYNWVMMGAGIFFAIGLLNQPSPRGRLIRLILAGFCVGLAVTEGFDSGAILSLFVGAYALWQGLIQPAEKGSQRASRALLTAGIVAVMAACFAAQTLINLVQSQVQGVSQMKDDPQSFEARWNYATQWSLPPGETSRILVPGLYGYRMDSPGGGQYWGMVGGTEGVPRSAFSGSGEYAGILVLVMAAFAVAVSFSKSNPGLTALEKKQVWFWLAASGVSLLLSYGKFAPLFYKLFFALPYMSTIRNPIKFMHAFHVAVIILFGYGLQAMTRLYLEKSVGKAQPAIASIKAVFSQLGFTKRWAVGLLVFVGLMGMWWLTWVGSGPQLTRQIQEMGFPEELAASTAAFSKKEITFFLVGLMAVAMVLLWISSGSLAGKKAKRAFLLLGVILVVDLAHAAHPWIVFYDYKERYALNAMTDFLKKNTKEQRVTTRRYPQPVFPSNNYFVPDGNQQMIYTMNGLTKEWLEYQFQYQDIRSLDIIQSPRTPELDSLYLNNFLPYDNKLEYCGRLWELTNTRYVIGVAGFLDILNNQFDPAKKRFKIATRFNLVPKKEVAEKVEDIGIELNDQGAFAIFEFEGALPRAAVYTDSVTMPDANATLLELKNPAFDPHQRVLLTGKTTGPSAPGKAVAADIEVAEPKYQKIKAKAAQPSILMVNDRWHPGWKVTINGKDAELLQVNHLMRGTRLEPGDHIVEFRYQPPLRGMWVSSISCAAGILLALLLVFKFRPASPA